MNQTYNSITTTNQVTVLQSPLTTTVQLHPVIGEDKSSMNSMNQLNVVHNQGLPYTSSGNKTSTFMTNNERVIARQHRNRNSLNHLVSKATSKNLHDFMNRQHLRSCYYDKQPSSSPSSYISSSSSHNKKLVQFNDKIMIMAEKNTNNSSYSLLSIDEGRDCVDNNDNSQTTTVTYDDDHNDYGYETTPLHDVDYSNNFTDLDNELRRKRRRFSRRNSKTPAMLMAMISPILTELHKDAMNHCHNSFNSNFANYNSSSSSSLHTSFSQISIRDLHQSSSSTRVVSSSDEGYYNSNTNSSDDAVPVSLHDSSTTLCCCDNSSTSDDIDMSLEVAEDLVHRLKKRRQLSR